MSINFKIISILLIYCCLIIEVCYAQDKLFVHYDSKIGLKSKVNYKISQDSDGFILVATDNGLYKFDGIRFVKMNLGESLESNEILEAIPLNNNDLFISDYYGKYLTVMKRDGVNSQALVPQRYKINNVSFFSTIGIDKEIGLIYFTKDLSVFDEFYKYDNGRVTRIAGFSGWPFYFDYRNDLLYLRPSNNGPNVFHIYDMKTKKTNDIVVDSYKYGNIITLQDNILISRKDDVLYVFKLIKDKLSLIAKLYYPINYNRIQFTIDKIGNIWLYNLPNGTWFYNIFNNDNTNIIYPRKFHENEIIHHVFIDRNNNLWCSTKNNGVYFLSSLLHERYVLRDKFPIMEFISKVRNSKYDDMLYLGLGNSGFSIFENETKYESYYFSNEKDETRDLLPTNNKIYLTQHLGKLIYFNRNTKKFKGVELIKDGTPDKSLANVKSINFLNDSSIIFPNFQGLNIYNIKTNSNRQISNIKSYLTFPFHEDSLFNLSSNNIYKISITNKDSKIFLREVYLNDIINLNEKTFVGASNTKGIIIFNADSIINRIDSKKGLKSNQILSIAKESNNIIWATSTNGIYRVSFSPKLTIDNYTTSDGLLSDVVHNCVLKGDSIYLATNKGLSVLNKKELINGQTAFNKSPIINKVTIGEKTYFNFDRLETVYGKSSVVIDVSFLDYRSLGNISYKYRLEGLENDWQTSSTNSFTYHTLPPGKYKFVIYGISSNGLESLQSKQIDIIVKPMFWQTLWFRFLIIIGAIMLLCYIVWNYRNKKLEIINYNQKISELELQAIKAQFNPHFIYNCLNTIQYLVYKKSLKEAEEYIDTFSKMIRKTLHYSESTFITIADEIDYLKTYLDMEKMRFKDSFMYHIEYDDQLNLQNKIPSLLIHPYVENSIKHGIMNVKDRKGIVKISFHKEFNTLKISIYDNGMGIDNEIKTNSLGMKISKRRIETYNTLFKTDISYRVKSEKNNYTIIEITINYE